MKKYLLLITLFALQSTRIFAVDVDVLVRNQRFSQDTFFFDIFLQRSGTDNVFLGNSDFVLNFEEANFNTPVLFYQSGSTQFFNAYGNPTAFYDTNIGTRIEYVGPNAYRLLIYVQMPVYNNATQFLERLARIDDQELTHRLGTFYVTGATQLNTNPELSWVDAGDGLVLKVNHRDSASMGKVVADITPVNPALDSAPDVQASNLQVVSKTGTSITLGWTNGNGDKRMVLARQDSAIDEYPENGLTYIANSEFGAGSELGSSGTWVVFLGTDSQLTVSGLEPNTTYHFAVFEVNGDNGWSENYLTTGADTLSQMTDGEYITANIKVFLQGPYNTGTGQMNTHLRMGNSFGSTNLLPAAQPYSGSPWNYSGTENVDTANHPTTAVDWVLVELRSTYNGSAVTGGRAAGFLLADGSIVDTNGVDPIRFWNVNSGYYYVVIKHRNHLAIMSTDSILLGSNSAMYDFTTSANQAYGSGQRSLGGGKFGLHAGDANSNGVVNFAGGANDRQVILSTIGIFTPTNTKVNEYNKADVNLNRVVSFAGGSNDRQQVLSVIGIFTPTSTISTTLP